NSSLATTAVEAGSGKYKKTTPSTQYNPASLPPAITEVNLAISSGVPKNVFSIITISLNGEYVTLTSGLLISFHFNELARCLRFPFNIAVNCCRAAELACYFLE